MRRMLLLLAALIAADAFAAESPRRPHSVKCAPSINVWIEVDGASIAAREQVNPENRKRVSFRLIASAPYRGDAVLCNYATARRDVTTSYSIRCPQPRKERGYRHSYSCN